MEQEPRPTAAASRTQNTVYAIPHDWASIAAFLGPLVDKVDESNVALQLLVITSDSDVAATVTANAASLSGDRKVGVLAATSALRATRLLRAQPSQIVAGTPDVIVELLRGASLKLDAVRMICIAWADELIAGAGGTSDELETLMSELPKDAARTVVVAQVTPAVEELLERYARRARKVDAAAGIVDPTAIDYVSVSPHARLSALRKLLDLVDPASAMIFVREPDNENEVAALLRALGYRDGGSVHVGRAASPGTELTILFDLPASREELREAAGASSRTIALIQPRQLASLRNLSAGGILRPITLPDPANKARERELRIRAELQGVLVKGQFGRELLALEPLLEEYDGIEIAAAALQLLDRARAAKAATSVPVPANAPPAPAAPPASRDARAPRESRDSRDSHSMVKLFINVGSRDSAEPRDLVGAIVNTANVSGSEIGKVDIRESHSIVEVSPSIADTVIEKVNGASVRGRRAVIRRDEERPPRRDTAPRGGRPGAGGRPSGGGRPSPRGGARPGPRGPRSRDRE